MEDRRGSSGERVMKDREESSRVEGPSGSSDETEMEDREVSSRVKDPSGSSGKSEMKDCEDLPGVEDLCRCSGKVGWWKTAEDLPEKKTWADLLAAKLSFFWRLVYSVEVQCIGETFPPMSVRVR